MESILLEMALKDDKPVLGICRGIQFMNAYLGGDLYQDLPTEYPCKVEHHMAPPYDVPAHKVCIMENTLLSKRLEKEMTEIKSYNKNPAERVEVMAVSEDGLVEAISVKGQKFAVGVQWHPEFSYQVNEDSMKLVQAFVDACKSSK